MAKNLGFDPAEIEQLKNECQEAEQDFVYFEDELEEGNEAADEFVHIQFVGEHKGKEVIFDAVLYTLTLHFSSLVFEKAEKKAATAFPTYVPQDERGENFVANDALDEEVELMITELIEEIEENEEVKVSEHVEIDEDFEYGIGLDVCLNVDEITDDVVEKFVASFKTGTLKLDPTLFSFKSEDFE